MDPKTAPTMAVTVRLFWKSLAIRSSLVGRAAPADREAALLFRDRLDGKAAVKGAVFEQRPQ